jgi:hypothetical protein
MRSTHPLLSLLLLPCALACVPDFSDGAADGKVGAGDAAGDDGSAGTDTSDGSDGTDTSDGSDGTDGADGTDTPPAWSGQRAATFTIDDPRGRTLCAGTLTLDVSPDGHLASTGDCAIEEGPGSGTTATLTLSADAEALADDAITVHGTATLDIPTPDGGPPTGDLDGTLSADTLHLEFSLPIGGGGGGGGGGSFDGAVDAP